MELFKLRGELSRSQSILLGIIGFIIFLLVWWAVAEMLSVQRPIVNDYVTRIPSTAEAEEQGINIDSLLREDSIRFENATEFAKVYPILPTPLQVIKSFPSLFQEKALFSNTIISIWRNLQGYFWAVLISIPIGFLVGLLPIFKGLFSKQIDALRYLPLTALVGIFITWFGIEESMKVSFLAFGIIVYLLPTVIQRIKEVDDVYLKTVFTLGATDWQTVRSVYIPSVMSKLMDDIRVLTAISWTYIIIAELLNKDGGIGALIYDAGRRGQIPDVFAILLVIIAVGFIQDQVFVYLDKRLFPHKYVKQRLGGLQEISYGIYLLLGTVTLFLLAGAVLAIFGVNLGSILSTGTLLLVLASITMIVMGEFKVLSAARRA